MSKLIINDRIQIPHEELQISSVRSSGPGGQNVNKVSTKVVLRWNLEASESITPEVRQRLMGMVGHQLSKEGCLTITSQRHRSRYRNYTDCLHKLRVMILDAAKTPKRRGSAPNACKRTETSAQQTEKVRQEKASSIAQIR